MSKKPTPLSRDYGSVSDEALSRLAGMVLKMRTVYLITIAVALFSLMMVSSMMHGAYGKGAIAFWCAFGVFSTCSTFIISRTAVKAKRVAVPPEQKKHSLFIVIVASTMLAFALSVLAALGALFTVGLEPLENYLENYYLLHMLVGTLTVMPFVARYMRV